MATVQSFFPIFHWHVYKKKREGGREGGKREDFETGELQAGTLSRWGPFVIRGLEKETKFTLGFLASGSVRIFCNTQPGGVFVCQAHGQKKKGKKKKEV